MKRFLIATAIAALVAPTLAAPSFAQDDGGRGGRGGRGDGQFQGRGPQGGNGGGGNFQGGQGGGRGDRGFDRGDRGDRGGGRQWNGGGNPGAQPQPQAVQPAPQAIPQAPQARFQGRGDRGNRQFQGGQRPDRGQFQGGQFQGRQDRGDNQNRQFQGQGQGQRQFQGQPNFNQGRQGFDNNRRFDNRQGFSGNQRFDNRQGFAGRNDRFDNRRFDNRRYQGPPPRGGQRFSYNGRDFYRFQSRPYVWPRGYNNYGGGFGSLSWTLNSILPSLFLNQSYYIDPYQYGLPWADPGYQWVQVGNDALLIDTYTGMIVDIVPGVFYW